MSDINDDKSKKENPFNIVGKTQAPPVYGQGFEQSTAAGDCDARIKEMVSSCAIFIFMKGTPDYPQCGFSYNTIQIFRALGKEFKTFDVLSDPGIRQGIKVFSNWPTIPQVYIQGKFVGGNDSLS